jgi:hypothetical protein
MSVCGGVYELHGGKGNNLAIPKVYLHEYQTCHPVHNIPIQITLREAYRPLINDFASHSIGFPPSPSTEFDIFSYCFIKEKKN